MPRWRASDGGKLVATTAASSSLHDVWGRRQECQALCKVAGVVGQGRADSGGGRGAGAPAPIYRSRRRLGGDLHIELHCEPTTSTASRATAEQICQHQM